MNTACFNTPMCGYVATCPDCYGCDDCCRCHEHDMNRRVALDCQGECLRDGEIADEAEG